MTTSSQDNDDLFHHTSSYHSGSTNDAFNKYYYGNARVNVSVSLVAYIITAIALWKIFKKAGEKGWKSIIPIYNSYILYKISWDVKYFWIQIGLVILIYALSIFSYVVPILVFAVLLLIFAYITYLSIRQEYLLARSFGKGIGFTFGLIFLSTIFYLILAFSSSAKYLGNGHEVNENRKKGINTKNIDSQIV